MNHELKQGSCLASSTGLVVSEDGYVRMSISEVLALELKHFLTGLDGNQNQLPLIDGGVATISGYTEWLSSTIPAITVGWDWRLSICRGKPTYIRDGLPRTNLMVVDGSPPISLGDQGTGFLLGIIIDHLNWEDVVLTQLEARYS